MVSFVAVAACQTFAGFSPPEGEDPLEGGGGGEGGSGATGELVWSRSFGTEDHVEWCAECASPKSLARSHDEGETDADPGTY